MKEIYKITYEFLNWEFSKIFEDGIFFLEITKNTIRRIGFINFHLNCLSTVGVRQTIA